MAPVVVVSLEALKCASKCALASVRSRCFCRKLQKPHRLPALCQFALPPSMRSLTKYESKFHDAAETSMSIHPEAWSGVASSASSTAAAGLTFCIGLVPSEVNEGGGGKRGSTQASCPCVVLACSLSSCECQKNQNSQLFPLHAEESTCRSLTWNMWSLKVAPAWHFLICTQSN